MPKQTFLNDIIRAPARPSGPDQSTLCSLCADLRGTRDLQQRNLELLEHIEELDAFAHTVAHDIKGSLSTVIGFASLLSEDHAHLTVEEQRACINHLLCGAYKLNNVVDELLLLAEMHRADVVLGPLHMAPIVAEAHERLAPMSRECGAEIVAPITWPVAKGYGPWVEEVWVNYISNAIKYGGKPPRVRLGADKQPDGRVRFWVSDNGRGLTQDEQAQLFKPFVRLDRVRATGHGLGLAVVRHIVEKLAGEVGVSSDPGQGSIFSFTLHGYSS